MAIKFVTLRMGYGAETLLGHLVLTSDTLHETPQDAIRTLAAFSFVHPGRRIMLASLTTLV